MPCLKPLASKTAHSAIQYNLTPCFVEQVLRNKRLVGHIPRTELVRELEGFGFGRKGPMGSRSYQTQKATSEDVALIALAGSTGLEPATSDVTGRRSNQTELTPQAVVRVCFRSRALRGLVYTEVCPARNNFFEKIFGALREGLRGRLARVKFAALQSCARRKAH